METEAAYEVRKTVTLLFADVAGSTSLGEQLDPEALRGVMSHYFEEMRDVLERHGGTVEKFIGDAVMAVFGVPVAHEDDALRAVRAADEMQLRLGKLNRDFERRHGMRLEMRIGVNTGEVVAGDPAAGQAIVTGDPVNLAKRLEQAAPPGSILIGKATYPLVKDAVKAAPLQSFPVKGKRDQVAPFRVEGVERRALGRRRDRTRGNLRWTGDFVGLQAAVRDARAGATPRSRLRGHPLGGTDAPRPDRVPARLGAWASARSLPRAAGARRAASDLGRAPAERRFSGAASVEPVRIERLARGAGRRRRGRGCGAPPGRGGGRRKSALSRTDGREAGRRRPGRETGPAALDSGTSR